MLALHGHHTTFPQQLQQDTTNWPAHWGEPQAWQDALRWALTADLDALRPILATAYHPTRGRPPIDPVTLLRALGLQIIFGEPSISAWVRRLQQTPFLARLCGWTGKVPAVGTFYHFLYRLYPDPDRRRGALRRP
ncbi:transposase, partial [Sulfobacillus harzensis]|nr:transposase [Sulfobacillus harzensis]